MRRPPAERCGPSGARQPGCTALPTALVVVSTVLLAGCGGGDASTAQPVTFASSSPSATLDATRTPASGPIAPLTGLPVASSAARRPAVAVVLRLGPSGVAPAGVGSADIVYQQPGLAGSSRLVALYHSRDVGRAGPMGVSQPTDTSLLPILRPIYTYGGGPPRLTRNLPASGLALAGPDRSPTAFTRVGADYYVSTAALRQSPRAGTGPALQLLLYGEEGQLVSTVPTTHVSTVTVRVPGQATQVWTRGTDASWSQTAPRAPRVRVMNLLVPSTVYRELQADKAGTKVLNASVVGRGELTAVSGDRLVKGRWYRPTKKASATYLDSSGVPLRLRPGTTWILMAPPGTTVVGR